MLCIDAILLYVATVLMCSGQGPVTICCADNNEILIAGKF
jgi:hypothetical protein